jgi:hypothetical protein
MKKTKDPKALGYTGVIPEGSLGASLWGPQVSQVLYRKQGEILVLLPDRYREEACRQGYR